MKYRNFKSTIELTNEGQLSFFFLGTGSAFSKKNFQNNLLIIKGNEHILVDCGTMCPYSFSTFNSKITDIKTFLITHSHADHIGGLEETALMNMYVTHKKPFMIITDEYKEILWNHSLSGGCGIRGEDELPVKMTFDDYFNQIKPVEIKNSFRPMYEINIGNINIKLFRTKHLFTKNDTWETAFYSLGLIADNKILFTGDTKMDKPLLEWALNNYEIEWIFHDCQLFLSAVHAGYSELKTYSSDIKKRMLLCHYGDNVDSFTPEADGFAGFAKRGIYYDFD